MALRNPYVTLLLLLLAAISWLLVRSQQEETTVYSPEGHRPDYWARGLDVTEMNRLGTARYQLDAKQLVHFDDDDSTVLTEPRLTLYERDRPPWKVDATVGWVSADKTLVRLTGKVLIDREGRGKVRPIRAMTTELWVRPRENYAETARHVRVESLKDWMETDGLKIWFEEPMRMKLLSRVRARYEFN